MSLLETFFVLFDTNADKAARDVNTLDNRVEDLNRDLTLAERSAQRAGLAFGGMVRGLAGIAAGFLTFQALQSGFTGVLSRAGEIADLDQFAQGLGVATTRLDAFQRVAQTSGSSAQDAFNGLTLVTKNIGDALADAKSEQAKLFKSLGVNLKDADGNARNALDVLLDIGEATEKMSKAEATAAIKSLGIRNNALVSLILQGRALRAATREQELNGAVTEEQVEAAKRLDTALDNLELRIKSLLSAAVVPMTRAFEYLQELFEGVVEWVKQHEDVVTGFFIALTPFITAAAIAMLGLVAVFVAANLATIIWFAAIAALVGIFALLYEDFMVWKSGGKSAIGEIIESFKELNETLKPILDIIRAISDTYDKITKGGGLIRMGINWVGDKLGPNGAGLVMPKGAAPAMGGRVGAGQTFADLRSTPAAVGRGKTFMDLASRSPSNAQTSGSILAAGNRRGGDRTNIVGPVTVNTQATDAEGTGKAVSNALGKQLRFATDNSDDGVDR